MRVIDNGMNQPTWFSNLDELVSISNIFNNNVRKKISTSPMSEEYFKHMLDVQLPTLVT